MRFLAFVIMLGSFCVFGDTAADYKRQLDWLKKGMLEPDRYMELSDSLVVMGNASLSSANIIFLPEIHDDPASLANQLFFIAKEKSEGKSFLVLDESLASMQKSVWDIFSQKSLEIMAARGQRQDNVTYAPQKFEQALQKLANDLKAPPGNLTYQRATGLWTLHDFVDKATPFFGWDTGKKSTLSERNVQMVESLKTALKTHDRILIMAGARHVPELEFLTSQQLLCRNNRFSNMDQFFSTIEQKFGGEPSLTNGIGATTPIHNFLASQKYAVVFNRGFYKELERIVEQFKNSLGKDICLSLGT